MKPDGGGSLPVLMLLALLALAAADPAAEAEHARLSGELERLAERAAWDGVERTFAKLQAIEKKGGPLTFRELFVAAQSARARGDIAACLQRLQAAIEREPDPEALQWLRWIEQSFAPVELVVPAGEAATLEPVELPFNPDERTAIEAAQAIVADTRRFTGYLPKGRYHLGESTFEVKAVVETVKVVSGQKERAAPVDTPLSPRAGLSGGHTLAVGQSDVPEYFPAMHGAGLRLNAGLEVALAGPLALVGDLCYHGVYGRAQPVGYADASPASLLVFYLGLGGGLRWADLAVLAEGTVGAGAYDATGINNLDIVNMGCPDGADFPECRWIADTPVDRRVDYQWRGVTPTGGIQVEVRYALVEVGSSLALAASMQYGLWLGRSATWPYAALGVALVPTP